MSEKLKALTDKIYEEGIEKAKADSSKILTDAKKEADQIINDAINKRDQMLKEAESEIESLRKKVASEIKMASQKSINQFKQQLSHIITEKVISEPITEIFSNPEFCANAIYTCLVSLQKNTDGAWIIEIPEKDKKAIEQALANNKAQVLSNDVIIKPNSQLKSGFEVKPENGNFILKFDEEMFAEYFGTFLKVETKNMID